MSETNTLEDTMATERQIPTPSTTLVSEYIEEWGQNPDLVLNDATVREVFSEYGSNTDVRHVLVKVATLNQLFNTNIFSVAPVARNIVAHHVDRRLFLGDVGVVNDIAQVKTGEKNRRFYSFATKYCHYHKPDEYPIFDQYVGRVLLFFDHNHRFFTRRLTPHALRDYPMFCRALEAFRKRYELHDLSIRELDIFLWMFGKKFFA